MKKLLLLLLLPLIMFSCKDSKVETPVSQPEPLMSSEDAEPNYVDLQAVSIDPMRIEVKKGGQTTIVINIKNNGPDVIPIGEAVVHITVNSRYLNKPAGFKSDRWSLDSITTAKATGNYEIWVRNSKVMGVNETGFPGFRFTVKGKQIGRGDITLTSSLSRNAISSDFDGANQSARTELIVK